MCLCVYFFFFLFELVVEGAEVVAAVAEGGWSQTMRNLFGLWGRRAVITGGGAALGGGSEMILNCYKPGTWIPDKKNKDCGWAGFSKGAAIGATTTTFGLGANSVMPQLATAAELSSANAELNSLAGRITALEAGQALDQPLLTDFAGTAADFDTGFEEAITELDVPGGGAPGTYTPPTIGDTAGIELSELGGASSSATDVVGETFAESSAEGTEAVETAHELGRVPSDTSAPQPHSSPGSVTPTTIGAQSHVCLTFFQLFLKISKQTQPKCGARNGIFFWIFLQLLDKISKCYDFVSGLILLFFQKNFKLHCHQDTKKSSDHSSAPREKPILGKKQENEKN